MYSTTLVQLVIRCVLLVLLFVSSLLYSTLPCSLPAVVVVGVVGFLSSATLLK